MSKFFIIFIIIFSGGQALQASSFNTLNEVTPLNLFRGIVINFNQMNYQKIYDNLVIKAKSENRKKNQGIYYENHHILPKCLEGTNDKENLVLLTGKEHFIAHKLLVEIYPNNKELIYPLWMMVNKTGIGREYKVSSRSYEKCKTEFSKIISENRKGKSPSKNAINNARLANTGIIRSEETRKLVSIGNTGKIRTEEMKKRCSEVIRPKIKKESIDKIKEVLSKIEEIECPYCHKRSNNIGNMTQHHLNNCKYNPNYVDKREELTCPHCGFKSRNKGNILFYHFNNCKQSPNFNIIKHNNKLNETLNKIHETFKNKKYIKCVWCNFESKSSSVIINHHNDNCKLNPNYIDKREIHTCFYCGFKSKVKYNIIRFHNENCKHKNNI